mmetsp:Transcript_27260/g.49195  ORF Transcript_27260/g.49195 Transcript_27260/m.49195 type:complete len:102 (+) Transcript_27260:88-393(+)
MLDETEARMLDSNENASLRNQWRVEANEISAQARKQFSYANKPSGKSNARDDANLDGRIVINYKVNVHAFYSDLTKRLENIQLNLQRVKEKSESRLGRSDH